MAAALRNYIVVTMGAACNRSCVLILSEMVRRHGTVLWLGRPASRFEGAVSESDASRHSFIRLFFRTFARHPHGIFVGLLSESGFHARGQSHARFSEFIPQAVGGGQSLLPALLPVVFEQIDLSGGLLKGRRVHAQQSHLSIFLPVLAK